MPYQYRTMAIVIGIAISKAITFNNECDLLNGSSMLQFRATHNPLKLKLCFFTFSVEFNVGALCVIEIPFFDDFASPSS